MLSSAVVERKGSLAKALDPGKHRLCYAEMFAQGKLDVESPLDKYGNTFDELSPVDLAGGNLESDNMVLKGLKVSLGTGCGFCRLDHLRLVQQLDGDANGASHIDGGGCACSASFVRL